jgi:hypothetical protein
MTGAMADAELSEEHGLLPIRTKGAILTVLLAGSIALAGARLIVPALTRGDAPMQTAMDERPVVVASRVVLALKVIAFLLWFHNARTNAEYSSWRQRRAGAWVFWGWIIPIGNLWIPFQLMGDIWRAGLPPERRDRVAWLPALWWTSWLLTGVVVPLGAAQRSGRTSSYLEFPHDWPGFGVFAVAGVLLIAIIRVVSRGPVGD